MEVSNQIKTIQEAPVDHKVELIQLFVDHVNKAQDLVLNNIKKLFVMLDETYKIGNNDICTALNELMLVLIKQLMAPELEQQFPKLMQQIFANVGDLNKTIRNQSKKILIAFIRKTRNIEVVTDHMIKHGFLSSNIQLKKKTLSLVPDILSVCATSFASAGEVNEIRRVLENLIITTFDRQKEIQTRAKDVICRVKQIQFEQFDQAFSRLAKDHQQIFDRIVSNHTNLLLQKKFASLNFNTVAVDDNETRLVMDDIMSLYKGDDDNTGDNKMINQFSKDKSGNQFGFLPAEVLQDILNVRDSKVVSEAVSVLQNMFMEIDNLGEIDTHLSSFFKLVVHLLNQQIPTIITQTLSILNKLLDQRGFNQKVQVQLCMPNLISHLSQDRVDLRIKVVAIIRKIMGCLNKMHMLNQLLQFLKDAKMHDKINWHLKEELLNLISVHFLKMEAEDIRNMKEREQLNKKDKIYETVSVVASQLDDKISKVKKSAYEALAVILFRFEHINIAQILHELLDNTVQERLVDKVEEGQVQFINDLGNLALPVIDLKRLEQQRRKYEESKLLESAMLADLQDDDDEVLDITVHQSQMLAESEVPEQKTKLPVISYYDGKAHMSMKDRIMKSNMAFDQFFVKDHTGVDNMKYDIVIPIKDIKMTEGMNNDQFTKELYRDVNEVNKAKELLHKDQLRKNLYMQNPREKEEEFEDEILPDSDEERSAMKRDKKPLAVGQELKNKTNLNLARQQGEEGMPLPAELESKISNYQAYRFDVTQQ